MITRSKPSYFRRTISVAHVFVLSLITICASSALADSSSSPTTAHAKHNVLKIDNDTVQVGIDREKGASITWLSWEDHPKNIINIHDPGRLLQQSYYAGERLDRTAEGQSKHWSPWRWNPIQGGGIDSWARVKRFEKREDNSLYAETIPKLWDMPDEAAEAVMYQWTGFEPGMSNVVVVRNKITCNREIGDPWGPAIETPQEVPACYFTRNFDRFKSYLGNGEWRRETQEPGPPWGRTQPPRKAMACFNAAGQGIAIYSPTSGDTWNFGPHRDGSSDNPGDGPCVHVAPVSSVLLGPKSNYEYRYWLVVGNEAEINKSLDALAVSYSEERGILTNPEE